MESGASPTANRMATTKKNSTTRSRALADYLITCSISNGNDLGGGYESTRSDLLTLRRLLNKRRS